MPHEDHEKNRAAWNEIVDLHMYHMEYRTQEVIDGGSSLKCIELEALGDVKGKRLLHLMCQFGLDSLSWEREGAIVTAVDISDQSILRANELKEKAGLKAEFIRSDVLELIGKIDERFDIVFQSYGTHCWISDIYKWAEVIVHHLKPGGTFFIIDDHPLISCFWDPPWDYFMKGPEYDSNATDYCDRDYRIKHEMVEWQHPLSEIINALIAAGLTIERVDEYNHGYYKVEKDWYRDDRHYWYPPTGPSKYPLMFSLKGRKE